MRRSGKGGTEQSLPTPGRPTRRRGAVLEEAILDAAWHELSTRGWADFTIDRVAARSNTAKSVIYRRWSNRVALAREVLLRAADVPRAPSASSGDLRTDLLDFLRRMAEFLRGPVGPAVREVVVHGTSPIQSTLFAETPMVNEVARIVDSALARGDLRREPPALALNVGHALLMSEFLHAGEPPHDDQIAAVVDQAWLPALRSA